MSNIEPPVDVIYSSPFYRCLQTLKPFTDRHFSGAKVNGKIRIDRGIGYVHVIDRRSYAVTDVSSVNFLAVQTGNIHTHQP